MADISIWQKTGHFYFALTGLLFKAGILSSIAFSPFALPARSNQHGYIVMVIRFRRFSSPFSSL